MGKPTPLTKSREVNTNKISPRKVVLTKDKVIPKREKKKFYNQNRIQNSIGNTKQGHGFARTNKRKFLAKFRKKMKRKGTDVINISSSDDMEALRKNTFISNRSNISQENCSSRMSLLNSLKTKSNENISRIKERKLSKSIVIDYEAIQNEKAEKVIEMKTKMEEHDRCVKKRLEKQRKLTRKLQRRTKSGQPIMSYRLDQILQKLKKT